MCNAGPFTARYYCGTVDGEILSFGHTWEQPDLSKLNIEDDFEDEDGINERLIKQFQHQNQRKQF